MAKSNGLRVQPECVPRCNEDGTNLSWVVRLEEDK